MLKYTIDARSMDGLLFIYHKVMSHEGGYKLYTKDSLLLIEALRYKSIFVTRLQVLNNCSELMYVLF